MCKQIHKLTRRGIVTVDNPSYHSTIRDKVHITGLNKKDIEEWLLESCIIYEPTETISELLLCITPYKCWKNVCELDQIVNEMEHLHWNPCLRFLWGPVDLNDKLRKILTGGNLILNFLAWDYRENLMWSNINWGLCSNQTMSLQLSV